MLSRLIALLACGVGIGAVPATSYAQTALPNNDGADGVLRVCADPNNMPLSNRNGEGYENKIASQMASDFGWKLEYTYFPQRMGFIRNTLRDKVPNTERYKCDLVIGVPKGYELTSTTQTYLHSTYAMVFQKRAGLAHIKAPDDLLKLPPDQLHALRFGIFARSPATDWLLQHGLIDQATSYQAQTGDPNQYPGEVIEKDLRDGKIDVAFVWGPIAGYFAKRAGDQMALVLVPPMASIRFDYEIAMGVRYGEPAWKEKIDNWIGANRQKIDAILTSYAVPLIHDDASATTKARVGGTP
jgi:quinoprotein dehydrogenase-associated probable ABC transporter substrate-binding protein